MHRRLQFGMRENPASDRRHGSREAVRSLANERRIEQQSGASSPLAPPRDYSSARTESEQHAAPPHAATGGRNTSQYRLLTIHEVADLLQVPVSWVYEHTRQRRVNRITGLRLGKYWRFERTDIEAWIDANRRKDYTRVG